MNNLAQTLRGVAVNGMISVADAEKIGKRFDEQTEQAVEIAKAFKRETGVFWGERIDLYLSEVKGLHFNPKDYDLADRNGEQ